MFEIVSSIAVLDDVTILETKISRVSDQMVTATSKRLKRQVARYFVKTDRDGSLIIWPLKQLWEPISMTELSATKPTVVLVHGAWADASSWRRVIPFLFKEDIAVVAVQNPTTSLYDDVAATQRILDAIDGPIVLVGHSWGGAVITEAGSDPKVKALVFVAALPPSKGQSIGDLVASHSPPPGLSHIVDDGAGFLRMGVDGWINDVGQDLSEEENRVLAAVQTPLAKGTFGDKIDTAAWTAKPNWYVVSASDRVVSVELQRELAARLSARVTELEASHMSLLSRPQQVASVIVEAVLSQTSGD